MARPPAKRYTEPEKRAALELGAAAGRNAACRQLGISKASFQKWTEEFPEFWSGLRANDRELQKHGFAQSLEDLASQYSSLEFDALERAEKLLPTADPKELAALIRSFGASRGVAASNARALRGEDVQHVEHTIDFPALEAAAQAILNRAPAPLLVENVAEDDESTV